MCLHHLQTVTTLSWEVQNVTFEQYSTVILVKRLIFQSLPIPQYLSF